MEGRGARGFTTKTRRMGTKASGMTPCFPCLPCKPPWQRPEGPFRAGTRRHGQATAPEKPDGDKRSDERRFTVMRDWYCAGHPLGGRRPWRPPTAARAAALPSRSRLQRARGPQARMTLAGCRDHRPSPWITGQSFSWRASRWRPGLAHCNAKVSIRVYMASRKPRSLHHFQQSRSRRGCSVVDPFFLNANWYESRPSRSEPHTIRA